MEEKDLSPKEYFDIVKDKKKTINDEELQKIYDNCLVLLEKYKITGQIQGMKKLIFHIETIEKEKEIVRLGINTFVYRDDIENYIDNISKNPVKIIELENYEREIPDEIVELIDKVKDKFNKFYVVFTDYTGKVERQVEEKRREKDPILFGTFQDETTKTVIDRFYFIGDWEDEYCDLTLDKMVNQIQTKTGENVVRTISTPKDIATLKKQLAKLEIKNGNVRMNNSLSNRKGIFRNIKTFLMR
jgi:hypothetical protein